LEDLSFRISKTAIGFAAHAGRNTIKAEDIRLAAKYGAIAYGFMEKYMAKYHNIPIKEEILEISNITIKRMREVKEAIFKTG